MKPMEKLGRAGVLAAVLWAGACAPEVEKPPDEIQRILAELEPFPGFGGQDRRVDCFLITLQGEPVGTYRSSFARYQTPRGERLFFQSRERTVTRYEYFGSEKQEEDAFLLNPEGRVLRFSSKRKQVGSEEKVLEGGKLGAEMITVGRPEIIRIPYDPKAHYMGYVCERLFRARPPKKGMTYSPRVFAPTLAGYTDIDILVTGTDEIDESGRKHIAVEVTWEDNFEEPFKAKLSPDYREMGTVFVVKGVERRYEPMDCQAESAWIQPGRTPDVRALYKFSCEPPIPDSAAVMSARFQIYGMKRREERGWMDAPGQKIIAGPTKDSIVLEVTRLKDPPRHPFPPEAGDPALRPHLAATAMVQSHDPRIRLTAARLTWGSPDAWEAVKRLLNWVSREVIPSLELSGGSALEVLRRKRGDCTERSVLLAALARAAGIPARCVVGLVADGETMSGHMWVDVWAGRWHPVDPMYHQLNVDAGRIRFAVMPVGLHDNIKQGMKAVYLMTQVRKIKVLKTDTKLIYW